MKTHNDHIGKQIRGQGYYELGMLKFIKANISKGTYIDCGANIGNHSVYFAKECGCGVVSFEPDPDNYKLLMENTKDLNVVAFECGLGDYKCTMGITNNPDNMGMNKLINGKGITVKTLDSFIFKDVKLIKIDVEGFEKRLIIGGLKVIQEFNPALFIETNKPKEILEMLPKGYNIIQKFNYTPTWFYKYK